MRLVLGVRQGLPEGHERLQLMILRVATMLTVDLSDGESSGVSLEAMQYAVNFGTMCLRSVALVNGKYAPTEDAKALKKLRDMVAGRAGAGITHSELLRRSHMIGRRFTEVINTLSEMEAIVAVAAGARGGIRYYVPGYVPVSDDGPVGA